MQSAVDCNGSSSTTTITTTTTTTTTATIEAEANDDSHTTYAAPEAARMVTSTILVTEQKFNVLRHRATAAAKAVDQRQDRAPLINALEQVGSSVKCLSTRPSPTSQAPPPRTATKLQVIPLPAPAATTTTSIDDSVGVGGSGSGSGTESSSTSNSSSNSTISSVIATPILVRNGSAFGRDNGVAAATAGLAASSHNGDSVGTDCNHRQPQCLTADRYELFTNGTLPLPPKSASFGAFGSISGTSRELLLPIAPPPPSTSSSSSQLSSALTFSPSTPSSPTTPTTSSISSISSTSTDTTTTTSSAAGTPPSPSSSPQAAQLLHWRDMPEYLQFNPYVLEGYRPLQTFKGCLLSLFAWHNETINILTHAIPIVCILAIVPRLMPWEKEYRFLSFCHVFGSVAPWCGSFVYHLFMNIERGENAYYRLLKLDMVGIWVSQSFGALPLVTATTFCFSKPWKWFIMISYCLMSLWGLYKALTASSPWQRRLCFAMPFTMRSILTILRTVGVVGGNHVALPHVYLQDGVSIVGGAIGAMRIPEKWFPGLVDFYLNSHNIMHILVVLAVYSMHKATIKDFEWMSTTNCGAFTNATSEAIETTISANIEL